MSADMSNVGKYTLDEKGAVMAEIKCYADFIKKQKKIPSEEAYDLGLEVWDFLINTRSELSEGANIDVPKTEGAYWMQYKENPHWHLVHVSKAYLNVGDGPEAKGLSVSHIGSDCFEMVDSHFFEGAKWQKLPDPSPPLEPEQKCEGCGGRGKVFGAAGFDKDCPRCNGTGLKQKGGECTRPDLKSCFKCDDAYNGKCKLIIPTKKEDTNGG